MKITLTKTEMLKRRRIAGGLEPLLADCAIERTDGIDVDAILADELRKRYLDLLDRGDRSLVAADNIAATASCVSDGDELAGGARVSLPALCRRVFDIQLRGWSRAVEVRPADEAEAIISRQQNPYTAASAAHPVAVFAGGAVAGSVPDILAWPAGGTHPQAVAVTAAIDPGEDYYTMDEAALALLLAPSDTISPL